MPLFFFIAYIVHHEIIVFYAIGSLWGILSNGLKAKSPTLAYVLTIAVCHTKSGSQIDEDTQWQATKPPNPVFM